MPRKVQKTRFVTQALHLLMRKQGWLMGLMGVFACVVQAQTNCNLPLQFKDSIRVPDRWEEAWESQAPDASKPLPNGVPKTSTASNKHGDWPRRAWRLGLEKPKAVACQPRPLGFRSGEGVLWSTPAKCATVPYLHLGGMVWSADGVEALVWMSNQLPSESVMPPNAWVSHVRSGVRLLENLAPPHSCGSTGRNRVPIGTSFQRVPQVHWRAQWRLGQPRTRPLLDHSLEAVNESTMSWSGWLMCWCLFLGTWAAFEAGLPTWSWTPHPPDAVSILILVLFVPLRSHRLPPASILPAKGRKDRVPGNATDLRHPRGVSFGVGVARSDRGVVWHGSLGATFDPGQGGQIGRLSLGRQPN